MATWLCGCVAIWLCGYIIGILMDQMILTLIPFLRFSLGTSILLATRKIRMVVAGLSTLKQRINNCLKAVVREKAALCVNSGEAVPSDLRQASFVGGWGMVKKDLLEVVAG